MVILKIQIDNQCHWHDVNSALGPLCQMGSCRLHYFSRVVSKNKGFVPGFSCGGPLSFIFLDKSYWFDSLSQRHSKFHSRSIGWPFGWINDQPQNNQPPDQAGGYFQLSNLNLIENNFNLNFSSKLRVYKQSNAWSVASSILATDRQVSDPLSLRALL